MQIGCGLIQKEDIKAAKRVGFDYVEMMGKHLASLPPKEFSEIVRELECQGLRCLGINGYCPKEIVIAGPGFDTKAVRAYARGLAGRAAVIGTRYVGIGSPNSRILPKGFPQQEAVRQLKKFLSITAEEFGQFGITVCLEALAPCYCNFINRMDEAIQVVREMDMESIRVVLDYYNMEYTSEADGDPETWLEYIAHVHISDDDGSPCLRSFLGAERSAVHKKRLKRLYDAGYGGNITIEVDIALEEGRAKDSIIMIRDSFREKEGRT